jgi:penicillin-binding protein 2
MPTWLPQAQYKADSSRAQFYFKLTKDSSYLKKFFKKTIPQQEKKDTSAPKEKPLVVYRKSEATEPKNSITLKKKTL